jgi:peptidoglycan-N-acetylglucosamine deacetylase
MRVRSTLLFVALSVFVLPACSHEQAPTACGSGALGVARVQTIGRDSPPAPDLLATGEVVLSFDDGPDPGRTRAVLDQLASECTEASFFLMGKRAEDHPEVVSEIVERGHSVGGHSWVHANLTLMPAEEAVADAQRSNDAVAAAIGTPVSFFRFPFIATTPELSEAIADAGLIDITVNISGEDWANIPPEGSIELIMARLEANGRRGIILLHDPFPQSDVRTRLLLEALKADDYRVVALRPEAGAS